MSTFADFLERDRRLALLRGLMVAQGSCSDMLLLRYCQSIGCRAVLANVRDGLRYLADLNLVTLREVDGVMLATITQRGREVAEGDAIAEGVTGHIKGT
jgi:hypothetical protein